MVLYHFTTEDAKLIALLILLIIVASYACKKECFTSVSAKTGAYKEWLRGGGTYKDFIEANPSGNIVEYRRLKTGQDLSVLQ